MLVVCLIFTSHHRTHFIPVESHASEPGQCVVAEQTTSCGKTTLKEEKMNTYIKVGITEEKSRSN
jgi:hypothetical protein